MAKVTTKEFIDLVGRSGLVKGDRLATVVDQCKEKHGGELPSPEDCSDDFIAAGIITSWHTDKLLNGKYKGFFLGKYKLLDHLGTGGMSSVYLAEHTLMQQLRAVKVLPKRRVDDSSYLARFYREAKAAAALDHGNIVRAYDIDEEGGHHYIVMEYVEGRDLQEIIKQDGPLDFELAANYIAQAAVGLQHAHDASLIHRDIKPANLLVDQRNVVKVLDMGLARFTNDDKSSLTVEHDENVLGTADYLSPEQAKNSHLVDGRADLYSLGCTLYYVLTGHPPFPRGTLAQRIAAHLTDTPQEISVDRPDIPAELEQICQRMMRKMPRRRYQTATEIADALNNWLATQGGAASTATPKEVATAAAADRGATAIPDAKPPRPRRASSGGSSAPQRRDSLPPKKKPDSQSLHDTQSGEGQETRKGMGSDSGSKRLRTARPLGEKKQPRDSGTIDLGIESIRTGSGPDAEGQPLSLMDERRQRAANKSFPLWVWFILVGLALGVLILLVVFGAMIGNDPKPSSPAPEKPEPQERDTSWLETEDQMVTYYHCSCFPESISPRV